MPTNKLSKNDTLIINGQEIQIYNEEDLQMDWINGDLYINATITYNGNESFGILVLKSDIERLREIFNARG